MASGKSSLGKKIAKQLGLEFYDLDQEVERFWNKTISDFFKADNGEANFRLAERDQLRSIALNNAMIATGGGTPCYHNNMDWMNDNGLTVYLKLTPEALYSRLIQAKGERPLLKGKTGESLLDYIKEMLETREPYYAKAKVSVDPLNEGLNEIVTKLHGYMEIRN